VAIGRWKTFAGLAGKSGPGKNTWFDGQQEMEQVLPRFGRFVNDVEGNHQRDAAIMLAKFLLATRRGGQKHDQSRLSPGGNMKRSKCGAATHFHSDMAYIAAETGDHRSQSAVVSLWDNMVNKKFYLTGGPRSVTVAITVNLKETKKFSLRSHSRSGAIFRNHALQVTRYCMLFCIR
jgi:hypothetical protein